MGLFVCELDSDREEGSPRGQDRAMKIGERFKKGRE